MSQIPVVSVIIPSYNYALFLPETLESVMAQSFESWECIVVDDGSIDNTSDIVKEYQSRDARIKYVFQENRGLSASRNTGVKHSNGKYIQLLDADDLIEPEKLKAQVEFLERHHDYSLVYGAVRHFLKNSNKAGVFLERDMPKVSGDFHQIIPHLVNDNIFLVSAPLFEKCIFNQIGFFDETLRSLEDWDFWFRYVLNGQKFCYLNKDYTATQIRAHDVNMSSNHKRMWEAKKIVRQKITTYLVKTKQKCPGDLIISGTIKKNNFLIEKDKGLFAICFENWINGFLHTFKASVMSLNPIREYKDALYWFKYRLTRL